MFIDFKQAFDSIFRDRLIEDMKRMEIPSKLIRLSKMTMDGSQAKAISNGRLTRPIKIEIGVRQGDALSTTLFNIVLDGAVRAAGITGTIAQSSKQVIAYADDVALMARSKKSLEEGLLALGREAKRRGLEINQSKTKYMISTRRTLEGTGQLRTGEYGFKQV